LMMTGAERLREIMTELVKRASAVVQLRQYVTVTKMGGYRRRRHGQWSPAGNLTKCWRQT